MDTKQVQAPSALLLKNESVVPNQVSKDEKSTLRHQLDDLLFGSVAGIIGKVVEYPFDTIKVRLQTQPLETPYFSGPWDCFKSTVKQEGLRGLYTGMSSPLFGSMVENAALFVGYRQVQRMIRDYSWTNEEKEKYRNIPEDDLPSLSMPQLVAAGGASGAIASLVLTPVELIKCKLQVQIGATNITGVHFTGPFHVVRHVLQTHGLAGFYRGFLATLLRESGGGAFWFGTYEYTCYHFIKHRESQTGMKVTKKDLSPAELMLGGALGGMAYNASLFPVDVIKSHMQTDEQLLAKGSGQRSFFQTAKELYAVGGYKAFYRGCGITVARSAPTSAVIFLTYELLSRHFG